MKIIFLDVDGVLNSTNSLMTDTSLEKLPIRNLKILVDSVGAKIVLTSTWRLCFNPLRELMDELAAAGLSIYSMTPEGASISWLKTKGFAPTNRFIDTTNNITTDRGAEILRWLNEHKDVDSFVILDDEIFDIKSYFPFNYVKVNFANGLTFEDIAAAHKILSKAK